MIKRTSFFLIVISIAIPFVIYFYFLQWRTAAIYGDDLSIFIRHAGLKGFGSRINLDLLYGKFRPVHGFMVDLLINTFQKDLRGYYMFNVSVQAINTYLFAILLNLFLRSPFLSLLLGCIAGLSRFSFFNVTQLFNGGALEGLAITFFLLTLYFILKTLVQPGLTLIKKQTYILTSLVFANFAIYTHERYVVLFVFIIIIVLLFPGLKFTKIQRAGLIVLAVGSVVLNIVIKKYFYSLDFLVGTSGSKIELSLLSAVSFLRDAILSIIQINSGPPYLTGIDFRSLPVFNKGVILVLICGTSLIWIVYIFRAKKAFTEKENTQSSQFPILLFLSVLSGLLLVPAIVTIRLEQRWLQAPLCIFILINAIVFSGSFQNANRKITYIPLVFFAILFLWSDYNYLYKGADLIYMAYTEKSALVIKESVSKGVIRPATKRLYIWNEEYGVGAEEQIRWTLGNGEIFEFYQNKKKEINFVYAREREYYFPSKPAGNFNTDTIQVIDMIDNPIRDLTGQYVKKLPNQTLYHQKKLLITNNDFDNFLVKGFHANENGISWTSGDARIEFLSDYEVVDSVTVVLSAYMIPACKDVNPRIIITDNKNMEYKLKPEENKDGQFIYKFHFKKSINIKRITILSKTINALPDVRILSFPFISLEIRK
ncbi:MAG TPA: hypothetical protein VK645_01305 [Chitinophagaceae bacterium]|nr:hypothetical protein [Chitinophagaceae bacterium]